MSKKNFSKDKLSCYSFSPPKRLVFVFYFDAQIDLLLVSKKKQTDKQKELWERIILSSRGRSKSTKITNERKENGDYRNSCQPS